jgi:hypothetical protein
LLLAATALLLPSCEGGGHFTILGYTTRPNYDCNIKTVRLPIFKNRTLYRGLEFDLTRAVQRTIEARTTFKVVAEDQPADTELTGTIITFSKTVINSTPTNEVRQANTMLGVEIIWRDLRTGEILSKPKSGPGAPPPPPPPDAPPLPPGKPPPPPPVTLVQSLGGFIPELGQSLTTAQQQNVNRLAVRIVGLMEEPW